MQERHSPLPSADRMGMLIASVLLTFALSRMIETPGLTLSLSLPGFYYAFPITLGTVMTLFAAALTAAGMDWLLREHPAAGERSHREHLLLPALTAFVLGTPLALLSTSEAWWPGIAFGAALFTAVCIAEYISMDPSTPLYGPARAGLTAVAYALFLVLATSLRFSGARMVLVIPALFFVAGLISLRILHLDGTDRWDFPWAFGIGLICAQVGAGLHYWPLTPVQFGLALTGPLYALALLSMSLSENTPLRRAVMGPALIVLAAWGSAFLL
ncbi:MAG: hypothetical protein IPG44_11875 [Anaerolineales bacterium]|jgi:hypothetical protein|nr:hypothetical protein [Anaerolineales bacterium]MCC6985531.1 hypothetical protein [Anaerolineales bacterium]